MIIQLRVSVKFLKFCTLLATRMYNLIYYIIIEVQYASDIEIYILVADNVQIKFTYYYREDDEHQFIHSF